MKQISEKHRLDHIDALRGIAAILVLFQHSSEFILRIMPMGGLHTLLGWFTHDWFNFGKLGVVAFFTISGFVIPFSFKGSKPLEGFVISRVFRLYPTYWLSMLLAVLTAHLFNHRYTYHEIFANLTMVQAVLGQPDMLAVYWTLFVEVAFYAICFCAFALGWMRSAIYVVGVFALFLTAAWGVAFINWHFGKNLPLSLVLGLCVMHFGTLTRLMLIEQDERARQLFPYAIGALLLSLGPVCWMGYAHATEWGGSLPYTTAYYAAIGLFLWCVRKRAFVSRETKFLGAISYALYLIHPLFGFGAVRLSALFDWPFAGVVIVLTMAASIPAAWLVHIWLEKPAMLMGKRVTGWVGTRPITSRPAWEKV